MSNIMLFMYFAIIDLLNELKPCCPKGVHTASIEFTEKVPFYVQIYYIVHANVNLPNQFQPQCLSCVLISTGKCDLLVKCDLITACVLIHKYLTSFSSIEIFRWHPNSKVKVASLWPLWCEGWTVCDLLWISNMPFQQYYWKTFCWLGGHWPTHPRFLFYIVVLALLLALTLRGIYYVVYIIKYHRISGLCV